MNKETMQILFGLVGGLAIFIYGMNLMSACLQKAAGEKMKSILGMLTRNPVMGVLAGAVTTAVLQSSSATTVMAIGFVSAGLMSLPQAISIILGANIGTTMTAQLLAFKISDYIYAIIFVGFLVNFVCKSEKVKAIGETVFAFGLLFEGIEIMGSVMKPLAGSPLFVELLGKVGNVPVLGVLLGTVMTLVVQSSSATIAVLQNFASQAGPDGVTSIIGLAGAIPVLLGDNIGTTITALLASIGQSKDAKRTALAHCTFNVSGCLLFIWFVKPYAWLIQQLSPKGPEVEVISRQIANAHTVFNLIMTVLWIPFLWVLVKIVCTLIPDGPVASASLLTPRFLDKNLIGQPAAALQLAAKEILHCSDLVGQELRIASQAVAAGAAHLPEGLAQTAAAVHALSDRITEYMSELYAAGVLTEQQATQTAGIMYVLSDIDRIAQLCDDMAKDIAAHRTGPAESQFTDEAMAELSTSLNVIEAMFTGAMQVMQNKDSKEAQAIRIEKEQVLDLDLRMRRHHVARVKEGRCSAALTAPFSTVLHSIDRMGNACVNIVDAALGEMDFGYFLQEEQAV
ncbi:MAG: Na/Pi cotransporter family protein [Gemmiger sp.]